MFLSFDKDVEGIFSLFENYPVLLFTILGENISFLIMCKGGFFYKTSTI